VRGYLSVRDAPNTYLTRRTPVYGSPARQQGDANIRRRKQRRAQCAPDPFYWIFL